MLEKEAEQRRGEISCLAAVLFFCHRKGECGYDLQRMRYEADTGTNHLSQLRSFAAAGSSLEEKKVRYCISAEPAAIG